METLEQYGIKDVTPGNSEGMSERVYGVFNKNRRNLNVFVGDSLRAVLNDAIYQGNVVMGQRHYGNTDTSVWLDEVRYN